MKGDPLAQGKVVDQAIRAFRPGGRQGGGHGIPRQRLDQRVMERVETGRRGNGLRRLAGIKIRWKGRDIEGQDQLSLGGALRSRNTGEARDHQRGDQEPYGRVAVHRRSSCKEEQHPQARERCQYS
jgi:hypothetical protein